MGVVVCEEQLLNHIVCIVLCEQAYGGINDVWAD